MLRIEMDHYDLLLNTDPCSIFDYYNVEEMHGLNKKDCMLHLNNNQQAYIAGWCNHIPHEGEYHVSDRCFVFINLNRCNSHLDLICNLYHELMHWAINHYNEDLSFEEEMITIAEEETRKVYELIKYLI
jgi:hypothetical protein